MIASLGLTEEEAKARLREKARARRAADPEKYREINRRWKENNPDRLREINAKASAKARSKQDYKEKVYWAWVKSHYGITKDAWLSLWDAQGHACAVCGTQDFSTSVGGKPAVDHCHRTGKVRGLLCMGCNTALGSMKDNPAVLMAGASYLEKHA